MTAKLDISDDSNLALPKPKSTTANLEAILEYTQRPSSKTNTQDINLSSSLQKLLRSNDMTETGNLQALIDMDNLQVAILMQHSNELDFSNMNSTNELLKIANLLPKERLKL